MKAFRTMLLGATLIVGTTPFLAADSRWQGDRQDRDHDGDNDRGRQNNGNSAYQDGYRQGHWDAQHNQRSQMRGGGNGRDQQSYQAGYNRGWSDARNNSYGNGGYGNGGYGNGGYGNRGGYGNGGYGNGGYGNNSMGSARQFGYQDGLNDGASDRQTGHSFRPTQGDNYRNATRGYQSSFGNRDQYKQEYRQAYQQAYQQGYNGNGGYYGRR